MISLSLIGIGSGNPEHITLAAIRALNAADLVVIPRKGEEKSDLADMRRLICSRALTNPATQVIELDLPRRDTTNPDYRSAVDNWHDTVAAAWQTEITRHLGDSGRVALLIWGDPSLYDSSIRIAGRLTPAPVVEVVPGITAVQALSAAHAIPLSEIGEPFLVTTGRRLREEGWPVGVDTLVVMLDAGTAFEAVDPGGVTVWWGAYLGMPGEIVLSGPLREMGPRIIAARRAARERHGWIMDTYILKRVPRRRAG